MSGPQTPAVYQRAGVGSLGEGAPTPTDLPAGATVNLPCRCVYGHGRTVRYVWQGCYRHGQEQAVGTASLLLRRGMPNLALDVLKAAS